jgi:hypothetical protein
LRAVTDDAVTARRLVMPKLTSIHSSTRGDSLAQFVAFVTSIRQDNVRDPSPASYYRMN